MAFKRNISQTYSKYVRFYIMKQYTAQNIKKHFDTFQFGTDRN